MTTLLMALVPKMKSTESLLEALTANANTAGLGLLITAIVNTFQQGLTLYHAIFIQHILFFLGLSIYPITKLEGGIASIIITFIVSVCVTAAYSAWALYIWTHTS